MPADRHLKPRPVSTHLPHSERSKERLAYLRPSRPVRPTPYEKTAGHSRRARKGVPQAPSAKVPGDRALFGTPRSRRSRRSSTLRLPRLTMGHNADASLPRSASAKTQHLATVRGPLNSFPRVGCRVAQRPLDVEGDRIVAAKMPENYSVLVFFAWISYRARFSASRHQTAVSRASRNFFKTFGGTPCELRKHHHVGGVPPWGNACRGNEVGNGFRAGLWA